MGGLAAGLVLTAGLLVGAAAAVVVVRRRRRAEAAEETPLSSASSAAHATSPVSLSVPPQTPGLGAEAAPEAEDEPSRSRSLSSAYASRTGSLGLLSPGPSSSTSFATLNPTRPALV